MASSINDFGQQEIHMRYLEVHSFKIFLDNLFGSGNYKLRANRGGFLLDTPRLLSESELLELSDQAIDRVMMQQNDAFERLERATIESSHGSRTTLTSSSKDHKHSNSSSVQQAPSPLEVENNSILESIPSQHVIDDSGIWFHMVAHDLGSESLGISLHSEDSEKSIKGIYSVEIDSGESSKIYNVTGQLQSAVSGDEQPVVRKFAIKQLKKSTSPNLFMREYKALKYAQSLHHPNIVELLSVFKDEIKGTQYFNFAFPLALGNLKRLFLGQYDQLSTVTSRKSLLWPQMTGLASAVTYLHESAHTAHRDIKPSNVLIYQDNAGGNLVLKLTDFGLAINLTNAMTWEEGSIAASTARNNDAPEVRRAYAKSREGGFQELPLPTQMLSNDIWKLGCVLTELAVFIVGGSSGVTSFRDSITVETGNISSDFFNDVRFDDGEKVKPEVMEYIAGLRHKSREISQLELILSAMLARSSERPSAREVCQLLIDTQLIKYPFHDGVRRVRLRSENPVPGVLDHLRMKFENRFENPIDWSPLPPVIRARRDGDVEVAWECGKKELSAILSEDEARRYIPTCLATFENGGLILPRTNQDISTSTTTSPTNSLQYTRVAAQNMSNSIQTQSLSQQGPKSIPQAREVLAKEVYWCIDEIFTEPRETLLCPIAVGAEHTDEEFYLLTNRALDGARGGLMRGWFLNCLSWKRCVGIDFRQFYMVKTDKDQVMLGKIELPPPAQHEYEHGVLDPKEVHMKLAALQMVAGLVDPKATRGESAMMKMLPKKKIPPNFKKEMGVCGWGIYAHMGFSVKKILWWLIFCFVFMLVFAAVWLACINSTDLQNASVPATIVLTLFTIVLGVAQNLG